jgi:hypothetical protein
MSSTRRVQSLSLVTSSPGEDAAGVDVAGVAGAAAVAVGDAAAAVAAAVVAAARPGDVAATAKRALNPVDKREPLAGLAHNAAGRRASFFKLKQKPQPAMCGWG